MISIPGMTVDQSKRAISATKYTNDDPYALKGPTAAEQKHADDIIAEWGRMKSASDAASMPTDATQQQDAYRDYLDARSRGNNLDATAVANQTRDNAAGAVSSYLRSRTASYDPASAAQGERALTMAPQLGRADQRASEKNEATQAGIALNQYDETARNQDQLVEQAYNAWQKELISFGEQLKTLKAKYLGGGLSDQDAERRAYLAMEAQGATNRIAQAQAAWVKSNRDRNNALSWLKTGIGAAASVAGAVL